MRTDRKTGQKERMFKDMPAVLLTAVLMTGMALLPQFTLAARADDASGKTITCLGTDAIANPAAPADEKAWNGSYVYYGKFGGKDPTKYRVLDKASTVFGVEGGSLFLDCNRALYNAQFDADSNEWASSDVKADLNGDHFLTKTGNFTDMEKDAIAESTAASHGLNGEKIFLLDAGDASNTAYGYSARDNQAENRKKAGNTVNTVWWLRSPISSSDVHVDISSDGFISNGHVAFSYGVSPAFNVSLSSVIFSSLTRQTRTYKLTIRDNWLSISSTKADRDGSVITVHYVISGNHADQTDRVSVVMTDGSWNAEKGTWSAGAAVKFYGMLNGDISDGTGTFTLPDNYDSAWKTYILAENVSDADATDYACIPAEITIPHRHEWSYSASGSTITAACNGNGEACGITSGLTMTISAPADLISDGTVKAAMLNTDFNTTAFPGSYTIRYEQNGSSIDAADVKAAGTYTAKVTAEGAMASVEFTITETQPTTRPVPYKAPTETENGNKAYYIGSDGKLYWDALGLAEILDPNEVIIPAMGKKENPLTPDSSGASDDNSDSSSDGSGVSNDTSGGRSAKEATGKRGVIIISSDGSVSRPGDLSDPDSHWRLDGDGNWHYTNVNGRSARNEWVQISYNGRTDWYAFDEDGRMRMGWFYSGGEYFYLEKHTTGFRAAMVTGWKFIEGKWYYFETVPGKTQGRMYRNEMTPDGYRVSQDGSWDGRPASGR